MFSLLPGSPPVETLGAYAVLALIADPEAAKKRLDELVAAAKAAQEAQVQAGKLSAETAQRAEAAAQAERNAQTIADGVAEMKEQVEAREKAADTKERSLDQREATLAANVKQYVTDKEAGEAAVKAALDAVSAREKAAASTHEAAAALKKQYEQKVAELRRAVA